MPAWSTSMEMRRPGVGWNGSRAPCPRRIVPLILLAPERPNDANQRCGFTNERSATPRDPRRIVPSPWAAESDARCGRDRSVRVPDALPVAALAGPCGGKTPPIFAATQAPRDLASRI